MGLEVAPLKGWSICCVYHASGANYGVCISQLPHLVGPEAVLVGVEEHHHVSCLTFVVNFHRALIVVSLPASGEVVS